MACSSLGRASLHGNPRPPPLSAQLHSVFGDLVALVAVGDKPVGRVFLRRETGRWQSGLDERNPSMTKDQIPKLFADFHNADEFGRVRLNCQGTLDDLRSLGLTLSDGMHVLLDDSEELVADGVVRHSPTDGWVAEVDWDKIGQ